MDFVLACLDPVTNDIKYKSSDSIDAQQCDAIFTRDFVINFKHAVEVGRAKRRFEQTGTDPTLFLSPTGRPSGLIRASKVS